MDGDATPDAYWPRRKDPMSFWTLDNIRSVLGGTWLARPRDAATPSTVDGVCTDTRTLKPNQAFIALLGEAADGHTFLTQAARAGAALLILSKPESFTDELKSALASNAAILHVADTGQALLRLAAAYRRTLDTTRVIAVAGSNGKTTTVRLITAVLATKLRGTASPKSFNNAVGVPLTILSAKKSDQYLVCEVGTNAPGEIATLAAVVEPDIVVMTSIGREHLEGLGSLTGVLKEETSILTGLRPGGVAIVNADAPGLVESTRAMTTAANNSASPARQVVTFGFAESADLRITESSQTAEGVAFTLNTRFKHQLRLLGLHNASNAAAAVAVGRRLGVDQPDIERGLLQAQGPPMRLERVSVALKAGNITFVNDAYNANPDSVLASLTTFAQITHPGRRVLVLGDMLELGEHAPDLHREIGDAIVRSGMLKPGDLIALVGRLSHFTAERLARAVPSTSLHMIEDLNAGRADAVAALLAPGDCILLKGSRRMGLERIIDAARLRGSPINSTTSTPSPSSTPFPDPKTVSLHTRHA